MYPTAWMKPGCVFPRFSGSKVVTILLVPRTARASTWP
jgi:hypothetical protein